MKPIIFSTPMVQAILDGRKTITRRVVKLPKWLKIQPDGTVYGGSEHDFGLQPNIKAATDYWQITPYSPGDILWVRETWCNINKPEFAPEYHYFADVDTHVDYDPSEWKWRPSIHMPRDAARIFLRVTNVRVERLQEITEADAIKEGFAGEHSQIKGPSGETLKFFTAIEDFMEYWQTLNAKRGYGWDANPWVWIIEFERCGNEET